MNDISQTVPPCDELYITQAQHFILIIEDEKLVAWDMEQSLRENDFQNIEVISSILAARKALLSEEKISLVVLDLKLDDGDGTVLIDEFANQGIPVLVTTGYTHFAHPRATVLYKPIPTSILLHTITLLLDDGS